MARPEKHAGRLFAVWMLAFSTNAGAEEPTEPAPAPEPPASPSPAPEAPVAAPPPAPAPTPRPAPPALPVSPSPPVVKVVPAPLPTDAVVHVAIDYSNAWLEGRSRVDLGPWRRLCAAPCDKSLRVDGLELRMTAQGMTSSNSFVVDPGPGTARLRVAGGSSTSRELGIIGLAAGLPVTFAGMTMFGLGSLQDENGVRTAGIVTLAVGAAAVVAALPLLLVGSTTVRNAKGTYIAKRVSGGWAF